MISDWARAATRRLPEPDTANPGDAYRQRVQADVRHALTRLEESRVTRAAVHGSYGVTNYADDALRGAESEAKTTAALAWLSGGKPSDNGHMSPWDAAKQMWGSR